MTEDELREMEERARAVTEEMLRCPHGREPADRCDVCTGDDGLALAAEVRRHRIAVAELQRIAADVRAFWASHPGDHVVKQGISGPGEALLNAVEALR